MIKNNKENFCPINQNTSINKSINESRDIELKDLTEVDIFSSKYGFDDTFVERMLKPETKWNEKKQAFDDLTKCTEPTKIKYIKNTDRTYFIEMVKKLLKQPNINVVHSIINALNNLALGLNTNFFESKDIFPYLLNYLKEKKENIINSLINCLTNFSLFMNDTIINEKLINYSSSKHLCNLAKINLCSLIEKIIEKKSNSIQMNSYFNLLIKISKYLEDQNPEVREKSAKLMAFINYIKKDLFNSIANSIKLDNKKRNKIAEYEKLYINLSYNKNAQNNENICNENKNILNNNIKQKKTGIKLVDFDYGNSNQFNKNENKVKISEDNYLSVIKENLIDNKEEIISYVQKKISNINISLFNSLKWEERKEGFCLINNFLSDEKNLQEINSCYDYYFKYILINNKYFNEKNFRVLNESIHCINVLIEKIDDFSIKYYKIIISSIINKLNEKKVFPEIQKMLRILFEKISKRDVILNLINSLENKQTIIIKEGIEMIKNIINESKDLDNYPLQELINLCIEQQKNSNNQIKKSSIQLLCLIYKIIGKEIYIYLQGTNENILSNLKLEFGKLENEDNKSEEKIDEEFDISSKITEKILKDMKEGKWLEKKNSIEQIEVLISKANHNVISPGLNDLFYSIKNNLKDGNKNIVKLSINLVSKFLDALSFGANIKSFVNIILSSLVSNFSESKNSIKDLALNCVNKIINLIGIDSIIDELIANLKIENYDIKNEVLKIFLNNKDKIIGQKDNKDLIYNLIGCLLDKNINIRNNAKILIQDMMQYISPNLIADYINKLKPSYIKQINDIIYDKSSNNVSKARSNISSESQNPKTSKKDKSIKLLTTNKQSKTTSKIIIKSPLKINNNEFDKFSTSKKSVSKSPILPVKTTLAEYKYNIVDVLPPEENELPNYLQMLNDGDVLSKIMALTEIKKILIHFFEKNVFDNNQLNVILISFNNLMYSINSNINSENEVLDKNDIALLRYLLDDYIYLSNRKLLINSISDENLIYHCYEQLFILISSNGIKLINNSSEILSIINTIILCLLTNFDKTLTISSLIKIITLYNSNQEFPLVVSLSIKCLDKIRKIFAKIQNKLNNTIIFISLYNFFIDFSKSDEKLEPNNETESNALLMINELIKEFIYIYGENIWKIYHDSLSNDMLKMDIHLKRTIEILYKEINSENFTKNKLNLSFGVLTDNENNDDTIKEILEYVNDIKNNGINMNQQQRNNYYFEIISLLRINKIDVAILQDKIDKDIMEKLFELYYGIKEDSKSKQSIQLSQFNKENDNEQSILKNNINNKPKKEISEQSKRIMNYKNKIKYLTETDGFRNKKTSIKGNDENKQINNNFITNNMLDDITFRNKETGKNAFDEISNMKKKLEEIRQKLN